MVHVLRPVPVERLKLLVFDLDGTLIDSAQDLCNSVNAALEEFHLNPLPDPAIAGFVGNGAPMLMRRSLALAGNTAPEDVNAELLEKSYQFFLQYYREHKLDFTYAYEGVLEALKALHELHDAPGEREADDGGADQQAGAAGARHLRGAGPGGLLSCISMAGTALRPKSPTRWGCGR